MEAITYSNCTHRQHYVIVLPDLSTKQTNTKRAKRSCQPLQSKVGLICGLELKSLQNRFSSPTIQFENTIFEQYIGVITVQGHQDDELAVWQRQLAFHRISVSLRKFSEALLRHTLIVGFKVFMQKASRKPGCDQLQLKSIISQLL